MAITQKRLLGDKGENAVVDWLIKNAFIIIARNYCTRMGEVDIIAQRGEVVAFIEVKTRASNYFPISNTVSYTKQKRIIKAAMYFVMHNKIRDKVLRFDVATVTKNVCVGYNVTLIENAFTVSY
jgi:putative endonuclease